MAENDEFFGLGFFLKQRRLKMDLTTGKPNVEERNWPVLPRFNNLFTCPVLAYVAILWMGGPELEAAITASNPCYKLEEVDDGFDDDEGDERVEPQPREFKPLKFDPTSRLAPLIPNLSTAGGITFERERASNGAGIWGICQAELGIPEGERVHMGDKFFRRYFAMDAQLARMNNYDCEYLCKQPPSRSRPRRANERNYGGLLIRAIRSPRFFHATTISGCVASARGQRSQCAASLQRQSRRPQTLRRGAAAHGPPARGGACAPASPGLPLESYLWRNDVGLAR